MDNPYPSWTGRAVYGLLLVAVVALPWAAKLLWELVTR